MKLKKSKLIFNSAVNVSDLEISKTKSTGKSSGKMLSKKQKGLKAVTDALLQNASGILVEWQYTQ